MLSVPLGQFLFRRRQIIGRNHHGVSRPAGRQFGGPAQDRITGLDSIFFIRQRPDQRISRQRRGQRKFGRRLANRRIDRAVRGFQPGCVQRSHKLGIDQPLAVIRRTRGDPLFALE